ncbi:MAG TPA: zinc-binding alcohol dehydrogenase family protein [Chitinophaga sp.]|uniref:quinone oxidoreductase family protein n=1 Tax=Chitinophaga sp. TaxID=1869181 RepID=UPI002CAD1D79|nr:zinc-binding alcohol dehydrogenase family protein [Chitinophaga sp.]HVI48641.1 zinc-binding alcohol dehydrogenase family protein [Chitinophaga sp.]
MKAIILKQEDNRRVLSLEERGIPDVTAQEVLIKTIAVGINYADIQIRKGVYPPPVELPAIMQGEVEGIITVVGSEVTGFRIGQRVSGFATHGYAEYAVLHSDMVNSLPDELQPGQGLTGQALTAKHLLEGAAHYQAVVITAAAGGVGTFAVQLAKQLDIPVIIAMTGDDSKADYVKSLGATHHVTYRKSDWEHQLSGIISRTAPNLILDAVGGELGAALAAHLSFRGKMVVYGGTVAQPTMLNLQELIMREAVVSGATLYAVTKQQQQEWVNEITAAILQGQLEMPLTAYPFAEVAGAYADLESRRTRGRVILTL